MRLFLALLFVSSLIVSVGGCGPGVDPTLDVSSYNQTNIRRLRNTYEMYMEEHGYVGPESEEVLKEYLKTDRVAIARLKRMGIEPADIDGMFVSERDGKPFEIKWAAKGQADHAVIFEAEGVDGKRLVALMEPQELGSAAYDGWFSGDTKPETAEGIELDDSGDADKQLDESGE